MAAENTPTSPSDELRKRTLSCHELQRSFRSLLLSTVGAGQIPEISYAPFIEDQRGNFWIFISELASHTANLQCRPDCSVLFIRDEQQTRNLFARERLSWRCRAQQCDAASETGVQILDQMAELHGETLSLLRQLPDFRLYCLKPLEGRYVSGFGKAWRVDPVSRELSHIGPENLRQ